MKPWDDFGWPTASKNHLEADEKGLSVHVHTEINKETEKKLRFLLLKALNTTTKECNTCRMGDYAVVAFAHIADPYYKILETFQFLVQKQTKNTIFTWLNAGVYGGDV